MQYGIYGMGDGVLYYIGRAMVCDSIESDQGDDIMFQRPQECAYRL